MPRKRDRSSEEFRFEWDEVKNNANIRKHGFDFIDAEEMFRGVLVVNPDTREDYGEKRWVGVGSIRDRIAYVVFTQRHPQNRSHNLTKKGKP